MRASAGIAKALIQLHTSAEVQAKAIELNDLIIEAQQRIFEAQAAQAELIERVRQLEGEVTRMKDWDAQKQRYKLKQPHPGCMVYALQKSMSDGEPPHYICASCYERGERSILQQVGPTKDRWSAAWGCSRCKALALTGYRNVDDLKYADDLP